MYTVPQVTLKNSLMLFYVFLFTIIVTVRFKWPGNLYENTNSGLLFGL